MILFVLSTLAIIINKCIFHYSVAPKGTLLLQLIYGIWMYSVAAIPIKAYNDYCDKKDTEKERLAQIEAKKQEALKEDKKRKEQIEERFIDFDYCTDKEKDILAEFCIQQLTTYEASGSQIATLKAMQMKGIKFISYHGSEITGGDILTSPSGLNLINKYFDRDKTKYFTFFDTLDENTLEFLRVFYEEGYERIEPYSGNKKLARKMVETFNDNGFDRIYWSPSEKCVVVSKIYFVYIIKYFEEKEDA